MLDNECKKVIVVSEVNVLILEVSMVDWESERPGNVTSKS